MVAGMWGCRPCWRLGRWVTVPSELMRQGQTVSGYTVAGIGKGWVGVSVLVAMTLASWSAFSLPRMPLWAGTLVM